MKTFIAIILVGILGGSLRAQTANQDVTNGLTFLAAEDLVHANQQFTNALALSSTNESANALVAVTRLLLLPTQPSGSNLLNSLGFSIAGRNVYNWTSSVPVDANSEDMLPSNNTAVAIAYYRTNIMAALAASRTNLATINDPGFSLSLTAGETTSQPVTVDYGDILMLQALERVAEVVGYTANAQNGDVVLRLLQKMSETNGLTVQSTLALYPSLLTLSNPGDLAASEAAFTNAISLYFAASQFIRNVRQPGAPALFILADDETNSEAVFRTELTNALLSLKGPVQFNTAVVGFTLDTSNYFSGAKTLRSLLPQFEGDSYVPDTLPDYSFGGILVNEPAWVTEKYLQFLLTSYTGIYIGDNGQLYGGNPPVSDYNYNNNESYANGSFAVFVSTNGQATLLGHDDGDGTGDDTSFGLFAQFTVESGGSWSFQTNGVSGYGSVDRHGNFSGELDYDTGISVYLYALEQSPLGPFQNSAGYYTGTFTGSHSGAFYVIVAADGEVFYVPVQTGPSVGSSGSSQFAPNDEFTNIQVNGTVVKGTLTPTAPSLAGTYAANDGSGNFTATHFTRSPFSVPPSITTPLPANLTAELGTNVTLSLIVTGSPPMCFQWYSNSVILPNAITNTLVLDNIQYPAAGTYSVTVSNTVGGTNSSVALTVVQETTPPTNTITAPTAGERWSNAVFTVTGTATDNVAVASVAYSLNSAGWSNAATANAWTNWTAVVTLAPGTNTIAAYAKDTSGNVSPTNRVSFDFVVTNQLRIHAIGLGTVLPNYSNSWLEVGRNYSITSAPASGFVFTNWIISTNSIAGGATAAHTNLLFMMASNLALQVTFVETSRPALSITAPAANQHMTNALATLQGTTSDNWGVAGVWYQLNGGSWNASATTNNWTNWSTRLELVSGTNALKAYAMNLGGNLSPTGSVSVVSSNTFKLQLAFTNSAPLKPNGLAFSLQLSLGLDGQIQVSTNLTSWTTLTNFFGTNSTLTFRDPAATNSRQKYYRAVIP